jgi:hypothetical protein
MSIDLMSAVWQRGPHETVQRFVLLALANYADQDGYCWPSYNTLAERCAISRSTAIRAVKALEEDGWIRRQARQAANGQAGTNGYFVNMERLGMVAERDRGSSTVTLGGVTAPPPSSTATPGVVAQRDQGSSTATPGVVAQRHPILNLDPSMNHQSDPVSEVVEGGDGDGDAAIAAGKRILTRWQQLTGRSAPRNDEEWWRDWLIPVNQLWARLGRDEAAAYQAMADMRRQMVDAGKTPFRPAAVVPYALAEMDRSTAPAENGRPQTVDEWTSYFAEA